MNITTKSKIQMFGVWCAIYYMVLFAGGWLTAGFMPPISPADGADKVAQMFVGNLTRIRVGMIILMFAALMFIPFVGAGAKILARIEEGAGVLTYSWLLGGVANMVLTFYPAIWWLTAAFRPERAHELIYLMNDMSWLQFVGGISIFLAMPFACAIAAFCDTSAEPVFPRWSGYANIWFGILLIPDQLLFFFYTGPFAWNGIIGLGGPIIGFSGFMFVNFWLMRKAVLRERSER